MKSLIGRCPHRQAFVLDHGIIGNAPTGDLVSDPSPLLVQDYILLLTMG